jgi:hypothetical protein
MDCRRPFRPGDRYAERPIGFLDATPITEVVCLTCGYAAVDGSLLGRTHLRGAHDLVVRCLEVPEIATALRSEDLETIFCHDRHLPSR